MDHLYDFSDAEKLKVRYRGRKLDFTEFIKSTIQKVYLKAEIIVISEPLVTHDKINQKVLWIADRHCGIDYKSHSNIKLLLLPFESAVSHLITLGKMEEKFDPQELYDKIFQGKL